MCIIAVCERRHLTQDEVQGCWMENPDGAGIAWASGGEVHIVKGLMTRGELEGVLRELQESRPFPYIVHFRLATSGPSCPELTHPFPVLPDAPLDLEWSGTVPVLAHNGHVADWRSYYIQLFPLIVEALKKNGLPARVPVGPWSDTRAITAIVSVVGEEIVDFLEAGKVAMLWPDGRVRYWGAFRPVNGVLFSGSWRTARRDDWRYGDWGSPTRADRDWSEDDRW